MSRVGRLVRRGPVGPDRVAAGKQGGPEVLRLGEGQERQRALAGTAARDVHLELGQPEQPAGGHRQQRAKPLAAAQPGIAHRLEQFVAPVARPCQISREHRLDLGGEAEAYQEIARRLHLMPEDEAERQVLDMATHRKRRGK